MNCFVFGEGVTELYVMESILKYTLSSTYVTMQRDKQERKLSIILSNAIIKEFGGKQQDQVSILANTLAANLEQGVECLVLADRDEGDTIPGLQTTYKHIVTEVLKKRYTEPDITVTVDQDWHNILVYKTLSMRRIMKTGADVWSDMVSLSPKSET